MDVGCSIAFFFTPALVVYFAREFCVPFRVSLFSLLQVETAQKCP